MNAPVHSTTLTKATQAADGFPRRRFTNAEVRQMVEAGIFDENERIELIRGELAPMGSENDLHGRARALLTRIFIGALGPEWFVATNLSLFLAEDLEFQPDLHVFDMRLKSHDVRGPDVLLAVELSSTTQRKDLQLKAPIYAAHGVRELWVLDLDAMRSHVFRAPGAEGYAAHEEFAADAALTPMEFGEVSVRLADLV